MKHIGDIREDPEAIRRVRRIMADIHNENISQRSSSSSSKKPVKLWIGLGILLVFIMIFITYLLKK